MSRVVSFFCRKNKQINKCLEVQNKLCCSTFAKLNSLTSSPFRGFTTHIVFQALYNLNTIVAQIELFQAEKVLKSLNFGNPVTLQYM